MKTNEKAKKSYVKKIAAAILVTLFVAGGCLLSTAAAAERFSWTVNVSATGTDSASINAAKDGTRSDTFGSYITVYNGKAYSKGYAYVWKNSRKIGNQAYRLDANLPTHPTLNFGYVAHGQSQHYYENTYGGFKSSVDTYQYD